MNLNPKQKRFCEEYIVDLNAAQAYIRAGYTKNGAKASASRLLADVNVSTYVAELKDKATKKAGITIERVLEELALLAFSDPAKLFNSHGQLIPVNELPEEVSRTISEVTTTVRMMGRGEDAEPYETTKIKQHDKKGSLDMCLKHLGGYDKDNQTSSAKPERKRVVIARRNRD